MGRLRNQVACGAADRHRFRITRVEDHREIGGNVWGYFKCYRCHLEIEKLLTDEEIRAAKVLGLLR